MFYNNGCINFNQIFFQSFTNVSQDIGWRNGLVFIISHYMREKEYWYFRNNMLNKRLNGRWNETL